MNEPNFRPDYARLLLSGCSTVGKFTLRFFFIFIMFFLIEALTYVLMESSDTMILNFGILWCCALAAVILMLPRKAGRIVFCISYYVMLLWSLAQVGYYKVFGKMMWLGSIAYAGEGADYLGDVLSAFPANWWIGGIALAILGVYAIAIYPKIPKKLYTRIPLVCALALVIAGLSVLPEVIFLRDDEIWGTHSEYGQSSSYEASYRTMYDAHNLYTFVGIYHTTFRDIWKHEIYPLTPAYQAELKQQTQQIDDYFAQRGEHTANEMTGLLEGKNVILVLMESMDDYMITPEDTPTIYKMMGEGINFIQFYTPGFGTARTINSEFCMNTGIYLPTNGKYVFNYVTNSFDQSIASQMKFNGYTSEVFHYNEPDFYSRGVFEPAMGYNKYNCYADYNNDKNALYDDCLLFEIPELYDLFFREGPTFNTIITRSAHLSYKYNEVLSYYALKKHPEYRGKYGSQEEDCARVKAKLVDDMFARLLDELQEGGQLENTVIIGMTDHYTYGYKNTDELLKLSGVEADKSILLEKTPCFIWSADCPDVEVTKTLNTADLLPTVLNLLGIDSPYDYLGQDAFDPNYVGYVIFPDGGWISDGVVCQVKGASHQVIQNTSGKQLTTEYLESMNSTAQSFINISNLLLTSDYYRSVR